MKEEQNEWTSEEFVLMYILFRAIINSNEDLYWDTGFGGPVSTPEGFAVDRGDLQLAIGILENGGSLDPPVSFEVNARLAGEYCNGSEYRDPSSLLGLAIAQGHKEIASYLEARYSQEKLTIRLLYDCPDIESFSYWITRVQFDHDSIEASNLLFDIAVNADSKRETDSALAVRLLIERGVKQRDRLRLNEFGVYMGTGEYPADLTKSPEVFVELCCDGNGANICDVSQFSDLKFSDDQYERLRNAIDFANCYGYYVEASKRAGDQQIEIMNILHQISPGFINQTDDRGRTPYMRAALNGNEQLVEFFKDQGSNPTLRDDDRQNAYELAQNAGHTRLAGFIKEDIEAWEVS